MRIFLRQLTLQLRQCKIYCSYQFSPPGSDEGYLMHRVEINPENLPETNYIIRRRGKKLATRNKISPASLFVKAKSLSVQQSIYSLGDPHQSLSSRIIFRDNYVLAFDERMRNPKWVFEKITNDDLDGEAKRKDCDFKAKFKIVEKYDFFRSKFKFRQKIETSRYVIHMSAYKRKTSKVNKFFFQKFAVHV